MTLEITSEKLRELVMRDADWVGKHATAENPVVVTDFCQFDGSAIQSLSPHITFAGKNPMGHAAWFSNCEHLKKAEGVFHGSVSFEASMLREIGELEVTAPNRHGDAASFYLCIHLKVARGKFHGKVDFTQSGIEEIDAENLAILPVVGNANSADFFQCEELKIARGKFPQGVDFSYAGIQQVENLHVDSGQVSFKGCLELKELSGEFPGQVVVSESGIERIHHFNAQSLSAYDCKSLMRCPMDILNGNCDDQTLLRLTRILEQEKQARETLKRETLKTTHIQL